jgi:hypothetical protein
VLQRARAEAQQARRGATTRTSTKVPATRLQDNNSEKPGHSE